MKNKTIVIALSSVALCASSFAATVPSDSANDSNIEYVWGPEWDAIDNTADDVIPFDAAEYIGIAFKGDTKKDPQGQAKLDAILASYGYAPGTLLYSTDSLSGPNGAPVDAAAKKMKGKKHQKNKKHKKPPKSPRK